MVAVIFISTYLLSLKLRKLFSKASILPSAPIAVKCALLWGGVITLVCLGWLFLNLALSGSHVSVIDVLKTTEYFILVPLAVVIAAVYGQVFAWFSRKKPLIASLTNHGLVGLAVGLVTGLVFSIGASLILDISYDISPGYGAIADFAMLYLIPICILIFTVVFGLFTPRNVLLGHR